jgi:hypothetical protein
VGQAHGINLLEKPNSKMRQRRTDAMLCLGSFAGASGD